jgi:hypothetical protein
MVTPTLQKPEGFRVKWSTKEKLQMEASSRKAGVSEGEVLVFYVKPSATRNLKFSGFPDVLGRSSKSEAQRKNNLAKPTPSFEFTNGGIQEFVNLLLFW